MITNLRAAVLSQHPLTQAMRLSLAAYSVAQVNPPGRACDEHDAWLCCCVTVGGYADAIVTILPKNWLAKFVRIAHWNNPATVVIRPVMLETGWAESGSGFVGMCGGKRWSSAPGSRKE